MKKGRVASMTMMCGRTKNSRKKPNYQSGMKNKTFGLNWGRRSDPIRVNRPKKLFFFRLFSAFTAQSISRIFIELLRPFSLKALIGTSERSGIVLVEEEEDLLATFYLPAQLFSLHHAHIISLLCIGCHDDDYLLFSPLLWNEFFAKRGIFQVKLCKELKT